MRKKGKAMKTETRELIPLTAKEALRRWDANESVFTVEMGGLGPGYEQCIHIVVFELIRTFLDDPARMVKMEGGQEVWNEEIIYPEIQRIDREHGIGLSGAQAGAAQGLAYRYLSKGYKASINTAPKDRHIQVMKVFPVGTPLEG